MCCFYNPRIDPIFRGFTYFFPEKIDTDTTHQRSLAGITWTPDASQGKNLFERHAKFFSTFHFRTFLSSTFLVFCSGVLSLVPAIYFVSQNKTIEALLSLAIMTFPFIILFTFSATCGFALAHTSEENPLLDV